MNFQQWCAKKEAEQKRDARVDIRLRKNGNTPELLAYYAELARLLGYDHPVMDGTKRICIYCREEKSIIDFDTNAKKLFGTLRYCKQCHLQGKAKEHYKPTPEEKKAKRIMRREKNVSV